MNKIQEHLVKLLGEIDEICISSRIPYVLYGRTARDACSKGQFIGSYVYAGVMIPAEKWDAFEAAVAKQYHGDRVLEWIVDNPDFPGMHMRYVDATTTFLYGDSAYKYNNLGIYVSIERVREIPSGRIKAKLANGIDKMLEYTTVSDLSSLSRLKRASVRVFHGLSRLFGREKTVRYFLRLQGRLCRKHGSKMAVIRYLKDNLDLSSSYLSKVKRVSLENRSFFVPEDHKAYLNIVFGKTWTKNSPSEISSPHLLACSTEVSFRDVTALDDKTNLKQVNAVIAERSRIQNEMKPLESRIEGFWDLLFLTQARFNLFRKYYPHRKELAEYLEKKDYAVLNDLAGDLMTLETEYLDKGLVMPVCKEVDQIAISLYNYNGDYRRADLLRQRLSGFAKKELTPEAALPAQDEDIWPRYLLPDADGFLAAYASAPDGRRIRIAYKNIINRVYDLLMLRDSRLALADPADSELVAFDGETELPYSEAFRLCAEGGSYLSLFQEDAAGRPMELGALTADGSFYPTASIVGRRWLGSSPLPRICAMHEDRTLDCRLFFGGEDKGRLFWLLSSGRELPVLEAASDELTIKSPRVLRKTLDGRTCFDLFGGFDAAEAAALAKEPAKLMCEAADGTRTELRALLDELSAQTSASDADSEDLMAVSPFSLRGTDIFGGQLLFAYLTENMGFLPASTISQNGSFTPLS